MLLINTKTLVNLKVITQTEKLRQKQIHIVSLHLCKFLEDGNYSIPVVAWGQGEGREEWRKEWQRNHLTRNLLKVTNVLTLLIVVMFSLLYTFFQNVLNHTLKICICQVYMSSMYSKYTLKSRKKDTRYKLDINLYLVLGG